MFPKKQRESERAKKNRHQKSQRAMMQSYIKNSKEPSWNHTSKIRKGHDEIIRQKSERAIMESYIKNPKGP
jgi:hypothetical protein